MGWFGGAVETLLFAVCLVMLLYHAWRMTRGREVIDHAAQVAFWAFFLVITLPLEPRGLSDDWSFWLGLALLALSVALTVWDKRRRSAPTNRPGAESDKS